MWQNADYWAKLWDEERRNSLYAKQRRERASSKWWDQRSAAFAEHTNEGSSRMRQEKIMNILLRNSFLNPDIEVLDIGSGPGNYALPMASQVKGVVALDPSPKMLAILEKRAAEQGFKNIETVNLAWEEVELDRLRWRKRFGLVFAAMTPGIHDAETLRKMVDASFHGCFYNGFSWRKDLAQKELWRIFYHEEMPPIPADIFYVFHLLYAWGYTPALEFYKRHTERTVSPEQAEQELTLLMEPYQEVMGWREQIRNYVRQKSRNGVFSWRRNFIEGNLVWTV
ncbi:MAG: methyltransferase domain-containing protein [Firmicutes bacterium]|nr:methyltransferase domain-containing protein [Bacillota bacterium]